MHKYQKTWEDHCPEWAERFHTWIAEIAHSYTIMQSLKCFLQILRLLYFNFMLICRCKVAFRNTKTNTLTPHKKKVLNWFSNTSQWDIFEFESLKRFIFADYPNSSLLSGVTWTPRTVFFASQAIAWVRCRLIDRCVAQSECNATVF